MKKAALFILMMMLVWQTAAADEMMVVSGGTLRLRSQPDFNADVLGRYDEGTVVTVCGGTADWKNVTAPDGLTGYMHGAYLKAIDDAETAAATVVSGNGGDVNLRRAPGLGAPVVAAVPVGTTVTVLGGESEWRYVTLPEGQCGYMMSRFLAVEDGGIRFVTSVNGGGVNMRSGPSQRYRSLGVLRVGTQVTLVEQGSDWSRIAYGDHNGYMMTRYLTAEAPVTAAPVIRSVRMSNLYPAVGEVLEARMTPADAQGLFIWSDDAGRMLGTGQWYHVQAADAGQRIRVTVTGYGSTTGAAVSGVSAAVTR